MDNPTQIELPFSPVKIHNFASPDNPVKILAFHCPGCAHSHAFRVGSKSGPDDKLPYWSWNGSWTHPVFSPSPLCNASDPAHRCHSWVSGGRIQFLTDCYHHLAGKTVDLPNWEDSCA